MEVSSKIRVSVTAAGLRAVVVTISILGAALAGMLFDWGRPQNWNISIVLALVFGSVTFCGHLGYSLVRVLNDAPAVAVLEKLPPGSVENGTCFGGFVAMEYFALILNRTYVVFVTPDRLYAWKVRGPVTNWNPAYFLPYSKMLNDRKLRCSYEAVEKLANLRGGFVIPRSEVVSVEPVYKQKWGMGGIPHSGRIRVRLTSGRSREFILLGSVSPERIRQELLAGKSVDAPSQA